tara:strand:+ start:960 stop:1220 length:261 start_codon:yes stop_codon:yes gene_type:complete
MKPTISQFENLVRNTVEQGLSFYGKYNGRWSHEGIAVRAECLGDAGGFVKEMKDEGFTLGKWDHQDSLGYDYIVSWSVNRFKKEKE